MRVLAILLLALGLVCVCIAKDGDSSKENHHRNRHHHHRHHRDSVEEDHSAERDRQHREDRDKNRGGHRDRRHSEERQGHSVERQGHSGERQGHSGERHGHSEERQGHSQERQGHSGERRSGGRHSGERNSGERHSSESKEFKEFQFDDVEQETTAIAPPKTKVQMPSGEEVDIQSGYTTDFNCDYKKSSQLVDILPNGTTKAEFDIVAEEMNKTMLELPNCASRGGCFRSYNIVKIQRTINGCMWKQYSDKQEEIRMEDGVVNEVMLYHGTKAAESIVMSGFDERYATYSSGPFGAGMYFTRFSSAANEYSDPKCDDNCERSLLLCRLTLGKEYSLPSGVNASDFTFAPVGHHALVAQQSQNPYKEYVVYRGDQIYPEYKITYTLNLKPILPETKL